MAPRKRDTDSGAGGTCAAGEAPSADRGIALSRDAGGELSTTPQDRAAIVCGVDHSANSRRAVRVAAELAERLNSRLVLVNVRPSPTDLPPGMATEVGLVRQRAVEGGRRLLAELGGELRGGRRPSRLLECVRGRVEFGDPAARLVAVADEMRASVIIVGARGRGAAGTALLGSVSQEVAAEPSRPLLVVPPEVDCLSSASGAQAPSIVCGVDGSASAANAARVAGPLAVALGLRLVLAHVEHGGDEAPTAAIDFDTWLDAHSRPRLRLLHRAAREAGDADVEVCLASGHAAAALEEVAARESAEMLAVGTRGHGPLKALALGSVSRKLSASSSRPVLIVNEPSSAVPRVRW